MLVLARSENEKIRIGDDIEIVVVSVRGNCVRLGITAPKSVRIDRQEVYERNVSNEKLRRLPRNGSGVSADKRTQGMPPISRLWLGTRRLTRSSRPALERTVRDGR